MDKYEDQQWLCNQAFNIKREVRALVERLRQTKPGPLDEHPEAEDIGVMLEQVEELQGVFACHRVACESWGKLTTPSLDKVWEQSFYHEQRLQALEHRVTVLEHERDNPE